MMTFLTSKKVGSEESPIDKWTVIGAFLNYD